MSSRPLSQLSFRDVVSHLGVMVALAALMGLLVAGLAIPFAGAIGLGAKSLSQGVKELPEELEAPPLAQRTRVLAADGQTIATFYDQNRVNVPLDEIAPVMQEAIIAIEDYRFYSHGAIDLKGTLRAFATNQANDGITQGGSSITQQMVKMTLLDKATTRAEREAATADTYQRKLRELRFAIGAEKAYSKDWILERYLNIAYFGDGAYGIQSAAQHYFSMDASKLKLRQAALLAGLVKNPVGLAPTAFPEKARERRNLVLRRMAELDIISQKKADETAGAKLGLQVQATRNGCVGSKAPFFCDYVRRYLLADKSLGATKDDRERLLNSGGLTIKTTLDLRYQRAADASTAANVRATDRAIGALAMVEPGTGNVRAISQSRPMGRDKAKGQTFLNYVVDSKYGDSNGFQAGSTFKLFVLAAALDQGMPTSTGFRSPQRLSIPERDFENCDGPYASNGTWQVNNSTGSGFFDMYRGTQRSVNTYFAQLEKETGLCKPFALARAMGVDLDDPDRQRVPSFTLGVADVSPLEMASAYATFAARGEHCANRPVVRILNAEGKDFKAYPKSCKQVMKASSADTVNDILRGVVAPGGFGARLALNKPSAGKTGTTSFNRAVWFIGYTPTLATASMIAGANQQGQPISLNGQTVGGRFVVSAAGSTTAGPMWSGAMRAIQSLLPNVDFQRPARSTENAGRDDQNNVTVASVIGRTADQARSILQGQGFSVVIGGQVDSEVRKGLIAGSSPAPGTSLPSGSTIVLYTSRGPGSSEDGPGDGDDGDDNGGPGNGNGGGNGNGNGNGGGNGG